MSYQATTNNEDKNTIPQTSEAPQQVINEIASSQSKSALQPQKTKNKSSVKDGASNSSPAQQQVKSAKALHQTARPTGDQRSSQRQDGSRKSS